MAITPRSGSSTSPTAPNTVDSDIPQTHTDTLPTMPFISDPNLNKFAIDTTQYVNATKQIVGFMKGKRISVTYYRLLNREGSNNRTNIADLATMRNSISMEYQKILNLELTLPKSFEFTPNNEKANMTIKGQVMFYPNMNPNIGDIFLTGVGDGRTGICRITSVTPTSWRNDRSYISDFVVQEFMDDSNHDPVEGAVTITSVFSKENYLGGTASLLSEQTYLQLEKLKVARSNLCRLYHQKFFNKDICSYMHPGDVYDPWVVQFMANKITMEDVPVRAKNLIGQDPQTYQKTLWARLEDRYNNTLYWVSPYANLIRYDQTRMGVFVTELYRKQIFYPSDEEGNASTYLYTTNFYKGLKETMTPEELMVYTAVTERKSGELGVFITNYVDTVFALSEIDQFYKIPIYIHLIDMSLQSQYREIDAPSMNYASNGDD